MQTVYIFVLINLKFNKGSASTKDLWYPAALEIAIQDMFLMFLRINKNCDFVISQDFFNLLFYWQSINTLPGADNLNVLNSVTTQASSAASTVASLLQQHQQGGMTALNQPQDGSVLQSMSPDYFNLQKSSQGELPQGLFNSQVLGGPINPAVPQVTLPGGAHSPLHTPKGILSPMSSSSTSPRHMGSTPSQNMLDFPAPNVVAPQNLDMSHKLKEFKSRTGAEIRPNLLSPQEIADNMLAQLSQGEPGAKPPTSSYGSPPTNRTVNTGQSHVPGRTSIDILATVSGALSTAEGGKDNVFKTPLPVSTPSQTSAPFQSALADKPTQGALSSSHSVTNDGLQTSALAADVTQGAGDSANSEKPEQNHVGECATSENYDQVRILT